MNFSRFQTVKNCHLNNFGGFEFWFLEKFHTCKCKKLSKIENLELLYHLKWQFLGLQNDQNWFDVESERQDFPEISRCILCIPNKAVQVCNVWWFDWLPLEFEKNWEINSAPGHCDSYCTFMQMTAGMLFQQWGTLLGCPKCLYKLFCEIVKRSLSHLLSKIFEFMGGPRNARILPKY